MESLKESPSRRERSVKRISSLKVKFKKMLTDRHSPTTNESSSYYSDSDGEQKRVSVSSPRPSNAKGSSSSSDDEKGGSPKPKKKKKSSSSDSSSSSLDGKKYKKKKSLNALKSSRKKLQHLLSHDRKAGGKQSLREGGRLAPLKESPPSSPLSNPRFSSGTEYALSRLFSEATSATDLMNNYNLNYRGGIASPTALINSLSQRENRHHSQLSEISFADESFSSQDFEARSGGAWENVSPPSREPPPLKLERLQSAYLDEEQGEWRCQRCGWTYPEPNPDSRVRREHKRHCGEIINVQQWLGAGDDHHSVEGEGSKGAHGEVEEVGRSVVPEKLATEADHQMDHPHRDAGKFIGSADTHEHMDHLDLDALAHTEDGNETSIAMEEQRSREATDHDIAEQVPRNGGEVPAEEPEAMDKEGAPDVHSEEEPEEKPEEESEVVQAEKTSEPYGEAKPEVVENEEEVPEAMEAEETAESHEKGGPEVIEKVETAVGVQGAEEPERMETEKNAESSVGEEETSEKEGNVETPEMVEPDPSKEEEQEPGPGEDHESRQFRGEEEQELGEENAEGHFDSKGEKSEDTHEHMEALDLDAVSHTEDGNETSIAMEEQKSRESTDHDIAEQVPRNVGEVPEEESEAMDKEGVPDGHSEEELEGKPEEESEAVQAEKTSEPHGEERSKVVENEEEVPEAMEAEETAESHEKGGPEVIEKVETAVGVQGAEEPDWMETEENADSSAGEEDTSEKEGNVETPEMVEPHPSEEEEQEPGPGENHESRQFRGEEEQEPGKENAGGHFDSDGEKPEDESEASKGNGQEVVHVREEEPQAEGENGVQPESHTLDIKDAATEMDNLHAAHTNGGTEHADGSAEHLQMKATEDKTEDREFNSDLLGEKSTDEFQTDDSKLEAMAGTQEVDEDLGRSPPAEGDLDERDHLGYGDAVREVETSHIDAQAESHESMETEHENKEDHASISMDQYLEPLEEDGPSPAPTSLKSKSDKAKSLTKLDTGEAQRVLTTTSLKSPYDDSDPNVVAFSSVQKYWADVSRSDYFLIEGKRSPSFRSDDGGFPGFSVEERRLPSPLSQKTVDFWNSRASSSSPLGKIEKRGSRGAANVQPAVLQDPSSSRPHMPYDLEQALHDQSTHDLICPVCGSCVTERIILRKRKRTQLTYVNARSPKSRVSRAESLAYDCDYQEQSEAAVDDRDDGTWGCLACFSYFFHREPGASGTAEGLTSHFSDDKWDRVPCLVLLPSFNWGPGKADPDGQEWVPVSTRDFDVTQASGPQADLIVEKASLACIPLFLPAFAWGPAVLKDSDLQENNEAISSTPAEHMPGALVQQSSRSLGERISLKSLQTLMPAFSVAYFLRKREPEGEIVVEEGEKSNSEIAVPSQDQSFEAEPVAVIVHKDDSSQCLPILLPTFSWGPFVVPGGDDKDDADELPTSSMQTEIYEGGQDDHFHDIGELVGKLPDQQQESIIGRLRQMGFSLSGEQAPLNCLPIIFSTKDSDGVVNLSVDQAGTSQTERAIAMDDQKKASCNCLPELPAFDWGPSFPTYELPSSMKADGSWRATTKTPSSRAETIRHAQDLAQRGKKGKSVVDEPATYADTKPEEVSEGASSQGESREIDVILLQQKKAPVLVREKSILNSLPLLFPPFNWGAFQSEEDVAPKVAREKRSLNYLPLLFPPFNWGAFQPERDVASKVAREKRILNCLPLLFPPFNWGAFQPEDVAPKVAREKTTLNCLPLLFPPFNWGVVQSEEVANDSRKPLLFGVNSNNDVEETARDSSQLVSSVTALSEDTTDSSDVTRQVVTQDVRVEGSVTTTTNTITYKENKVGEAVESEKIDSINVDLSIFQFEAGIKDGHLVHAHEKPTPGNLEPQASTGYSLWDQDNLTIEEVNEKLSAIQARPKVPLLAEIEKSGELPVSDSLSDHEVEETRPVRKVVQIVNERDAVRQALAAQSVQVNETEKKAEGVDEVAGDDCFCNCLPVSAASVAWLWPSKDHFAHDGGVWEPLLPTPEDSEASQTLDVTVSRHHTVEMGESDIVDETETITQTVRIPADSDTGPCSCLPGVASISLYHIFRDHDVPGSDDLRKPLLDDKDKTEIVDSSADSTAVLVDKTETVITVHGASKSEAADTAIAAAEQMKEMGFLQPTEGIEILKSVVYGGLDVTLVSLGVVSSAAGGDASTITVLAMGLANMIFGLIVFFRSVFSLYYNNQTQFREEVGKTLHVHGVLALLSFVFFGFIQPITYGFSFRHTSNRGYKFAACCGVALVSLVVLGALKAHATSKSKVRTIATLVIGGICAAIAGYEVGNYLAKLLEQAGFDSV